MFFGSVAIALGSVDSHVGIHVNHVEKGDHVLVFHRNTASAVRAADMALIACSVDVNVPRLESNQRLKSYLSFVFLLSASSPSSHIILVRTLLFGGS